MNHPPKAEPHPLSDASSEGRVYTCPMHPEVRQGNPGNCPKCGMTLELLTPAATKTQWTCPMHPQILRDAPGSCPICGMALEPTSPSTADSEAEGTELRDMQHRFWFAAALTAPLVVLAMSEMIVGHALADVLSMRARVFVELALATPVC